MKEIQGTEYVGSKEVAETLGIQPSTLRKYSGMMDERAKDGSYFARNAADERMYTKADVSALQRVIELKNSPRYTLEDAINEVVGLSHDGDTGSDIAQIEPQMEALRAFVAHQQDYLAQYQQMMEQKDAQIARLETLVASLLEGQAEDKAPEPEQPERGFLARIFKK